MMAANPLGATPTDTGEFMLGRIVVTPVLFDSTGELDPSTQDWTATEIDAFLAKVQEATNWWTDTLAGVTDKQQLEFVIDPTFATNPIATKYEPIDRSSEGFLLYGRDFLTSQGISNAIPFQQAVYQFNNAQREKFDADWSYMIFVADASDKLDGTFAGGGAFSGAFAYAGGQFIVMPSTRPASTITHETGHIFWAQDEYAGGASWTAQRGYYDTQNTNASDNPTSGFAQENSIMRGGVPLQDAFASHTSPASTLAMLGWQDSDGDGVFDLADVPLDFQAVGSFDPVTGTYRLTGSAAAVPLINRNSSGNQSDITLNRVSRIEYSVDGGPWETAATPNAQIVDALDLSVSVGQFSEIRWRAIDAATGITSEALVGTPTTPSLTAASVLGFVYSDDDVSHSRDIDEPTLAGVTLSLTLADGSPLVNGSIKAADFSDEIIPKTGAATLSTLNLDTSRAVFSKESASLPGQRVFRGFDTQLGRYVEGWTTQTSMVSDFDSTVGRVEMTVWGLVPDSFARIEAYDINGNLVARATSRPLGVGESANLRVSDPLGRIMSVKAFGHANTSIAISEMSFGTPTTIVTDASGTYRFADLPAGTYQLSVQTENVTQVAENATFSVDASGATSTPSGIAIQRVNSPFFNVALAEDVNSDGNVTTADALSVINDLNRNQSRTIAHHEVPGDFVDVNNDGRVTALDALMVVNWLNQNDLSGLGGGEQPSGEELDSKQLSSMPMASLAFSPITGRDANRDRVFFDWGDPADYGLETESNTLATPDRTRSRILLDDARQSDFPAKKVSNSPTHKTSNQLKLAELSLKDDLSLNSKKTEPFG